MLSIVVSHIGGRKERGYCSILATGLQTKSYIGYRLIAKLEHSLPQAIFFFILIPGLLSS